MKRLNPYVPHEYNLEGGIEVNSLIKRFAAILSPHLCLIFISLMLGEKWYFSVSSPSRSLIQSWNGPGDVTLTSQLLSSNTTKLILNIISNHTKKSWIGREPEMLTHSYNGIMASLMMCSYVEETAPWCLSPTSFFSRPLLCTHANRGQRLQPATSMKRQVDIWWLSSEKSQFRTGKKIRMRICDAWVED